MARRREAAELLLMVIPRVRDSVSKGYMTH